MKCARGSRARGRATPGPRVRGAVYLESLLVLGPLLTLILGITQMVLLQAASLIVQHAATRSVRSAVVVLEDSPRYFGGSPRGSVEYPRSARGSSAPEPARLLSKAETAQPTFDDNAVGALSTSLTSPSGSSRLELIRRAAAVPLSTLTPPLAASAASVPGLGSVALGLERAGGLAARFLAGLATLTGALTAITLRQAPKSEQVIASVQPNALVTVHVGYVYRCNIPVARRLLCRSGLQWLTRWDTARARLRGARPSGSGASGSGASLGQSHASLSQQDRRFEQFTRYVENPNILKLILASGGHFQLLEAEAWLPNQGARYYQTAP